jgi:hypothetical protein
MQNAMVQDRDELLERLMAEREIIFEVLTGVVCGLKSDLLKEIDAAVGELRAEMTLNRAIDQDKIVDLPNFLTRKVS